MLSQEQVRELYTSYLDIFPQERGRIKVFTDYIERTPSGQLYTRKNFDGHITTSAFIVNKGTSEILLLRHKALQRWLQPGGHVEGDESLLASARREVEEETAITASELLNVAVAADAAIPFDIDPHYIPPNPKKEEDGHYHHDIRYLFLYTGNGGARINEEESTGLRWVPFEELAGDEIFGHMITKIQKYI